MSDERSNKMMVIIVAGLLLMGVMGYLVAPFVAKNARARHNVNAERRNLLEAAIERDLQAFRMQDEETSLQTEE